MNASMVAVVHLGKDYEEIVHTTKNARSDRIRPFIRHHAGTDP